jgi:hypothetical protein
MNVINPLLVDETQMVHRERNGETHPPHYANLFHNDGKLSPADLMQPARSASSGENLGSLSTRSRNWGIDLEGLSGRFGQLVKVYWWVPAGFAVLVLVRSILGG